MRAEMDEIAVAQRAAEDDDAGINSPFARARCGGVARVSSKRRARESPAQLCTKREGRPDDETREDEREFQIHKRPGGSLVDALGG